MYSFFQYTPVVNYGSEVDDAATVDYHIGVYDGVWEDYLSWVDCCFLTDVSSWVDDGGEFGVRGLEFINPRKSKFVVSKGRDKKSIFINIR